MHTLEWTKLKNRHTIDQEVGGIRFYALIVVGMQNTTTPLENHSAVSYKVKYTPTM